MAKRTNNDLQNITQKIKARATRTLPKTDVNSGAPEGLAVHSGTPRVSLVTNQL